MEITIKELHEGLPCLIKNHEFFATKVYTDPFIERMKTFTNDFRIQIKNADTLSTKNKEVNKIYTRVLIQAVLPEKYIIDHHEEVIGFLYGIDVKKPVVKIYRGYLNQACTNMCVFNPQWLNVQELIPGNPIDFNPIKSLMESPNDFAIKLEKLKSIFLDRDDRTQYLGEWVDYSLRESEDYGFGKVKIAVSTPIDAYKDLFIDSESDYFIPQGINPSLFDVYNAFTQVITEDKKDLMNKFEKVMIINRLLKVE